MLGSRLKLSPMIRGLVTDAASFGFWVLQSMRFPVAPLLVCVIAFAFFFALRWVHHKWTGRVGLGLGDVKMLAACAGWIAPVNYPVLVLISSGAALFWVGISKANGMHLTDAKVPFGAFLGLGLVVCWGLQNTGYLKDWGTL